jgi:hypothetical protein
MGAAEVMLLSSHQKMASNRAKLIMKQIADAVNSSEFAGVRKIPSDNITEQGKDEISVIEDGVPYRIKVDQQIATAVNYSAKADDALVGFYRKAAELNRFGAITASLAFQVVNTMMDIPNLALMSRAGIKNPADAVQLIVDLIEGFDQALTGSRGKPSQAYLKMMDSGVIGGGISSEIDNMARAGKSSEGSSLIRLMYLLSKIIEETPKFAGYKRLLRDAGVTDISQLNQADAINLIAEVRNFAGSPDFRRSGTFIKDTKMNVWLVFVPSAIQGQASSLGRLLDVARSGRTDYERRAARSAAIRVSFFIGLPTLALYALNNLTKEARDEHDRIPKNEKDNNFMFPTDSFYTNEQGERIREYVKLPKRGFIKIIANTLEGMMEYYRKQDVEHFNKMVIGTLEAISPVDISGDTLSERASGVASSLNPAMKAPLERIANYSYYRRGNIVPRWMQGAEPSEQYKKRTNEQIKDTAKALGVSPLHLRSFLDTATGGLTTSLFPEKPAEGDRSGLSGLPVISRFMRSGRQEAVDKDLIDSLKMEADTASLKRRREAVEFIESRKGLNPNVVYREALSLHSRHGKEGRDLTEKIRSVLIEKKLGITSDDSRLMQLPPKQRAMFILMQADKLKGEARNDYLNGLLRKRIISPETGREMYLQGYRKN